MAVTTEKQAIVGELKEKLSNTKGAVLTNYRGLNVAQDTKLRRKLRDAGVEYRVIKNTMTRIAAKEVGIEGLDQYLEGPTAIAMSAVDPVAPAKILSEFIKENKLQALEIKSRSGRRQSYRRRRCQGSGKLAAARSAYRTTARHIAGADYRIRQSTQRHSQQLGLCFGSYSQAKRIRIVDRRKRSVCCVAAACTRRALHTNLFQQTKQFQLINY